MAVITTPFGDPTTDILDLSIASSVPKVTDVGYYYRQIADLPTAHVTIEEDHDDELVITQHPVEFGAIISDHAYKKPSEVRIRCGWNNSGGHRNKIGAAQQILVDGYEGYARAVYADILALQLTRKPFSVITGKRIYNDMLIANIRVHTAPGSEYSLMADIVLREVILVATKTLVLDNADSRMKDVNNRKDNGQQETKPVENAGEQARIAAGGSDLSGSAPSAPGGDA